MTASWGHLGALWGKPQIKGHSGLPTAVVYVRPQRHTKEYMDRETTFSLCVFEPSYKKTLVYLGSHSGRDYDKVKASRLTAVFDEGTTYFAEASMVFICKKLYQAPLDEAGFMDREVLDDNYEHRDLHHMYIGEIVKILVKE
jgi:flavin reductase (DIM6/NTAB) family NADH-FMN oxidoreductase RutF